ncbi:hypothetical protein KFL_006190060 [Klebsormidium nitens]|uniref:VWFA domain-containing protein n=1 Tax=Klebsormidium nitens TaxID=105231 RepID=A0A1Y1INA0_KLENI|nr:hypothetical protein KFL_006190060 [Klebsormidium nitens]|eukprot:GAQ90256.1 hypothetical protein KFL_006190060 [Klebsormidium nitens]
MAPAVSVTKLAATDWGSLGQKLLDIQVAIGDSKTAYGKVGAERHAIVLLDKSGSMSGSAFEQAKDGCEALLKQLWEAGIESIHFGAYDDKVQEVPLTKGDTYPIGRLNVGGMTDFLACFDYIERLCASACAGKSLLIVWLTDGCHTRGSDSEVHRRMEKFNGFVKETLTSCQIFALGFTPAHDHRLMAGLAAAGTEEGAFIYIASASDMRGALKKVAGQLGSGLAALLHLASGKWQRLTLEPLDSAAGCATFRAMALYNPADPIESLVVQMGDSTAERCVDVTSAETAGAEAASELVVAQICADAVAATQLLSQNQDEVTIEATQARLEELGASLEMERSRALKDAPRRQKQRVHARLVELRATLDSLLAQVVAAKKQGLRSGQAAQISSMAYDLRGSARLARALNKRVLENVDLLDDVQGKVDEVVRTLDVDHFRAEYAELTDVLGRCMLSARDLADAAAEGACFCVMLYVQRPRAAVVVGPHMIQVRSIITSAFATDDAFFEAVQYGGNEQAIHGGFSRDASGNVFVGAAREQVNAILPLCIGGPHGAIALQRMREVLGWVVTLDPLGFTGEQARVVPFLVLAAAAQQLPPGTERGEAVWKMLQETCLAVYYRYTMKDQVVAGVTAYLDDPAARTLDVVPSTAVFLMQAHVAQLAGDLGDLPLEELMKLVAEEEARRVQPGGGDSVNEDSFLLEVFGVTSESILEGAPRAGKPTPNAWDDDTLTPAAKKLVSAATDAFDKWATLTLRLLRLLSPGAGLREVQAPTGELTFRRLFPEGRRAFWLLYQNYLHQKNPVRRQEIAAGRYLSPFTADCEAEIKRAREDVIFREERRLANAGTRMATEMEHRRFAAAFAREPDVTKAGRMLRGTYWGDGRVACVMRALQSHVSPAVEPIAKWRMLTSGQYAGERLFGDARDWKPSRINFRRFWKAHSGVLTREEWEAEFPDRVDRIANWYPANGGELEPVESREAGGGI